MPGPFFARCRGHFSSSTFVPNDPVRTGEGLACARALSQKPMRVAVSRYIHHQNPPRFRARIANYCSYPAFEGSHISLILLTYSYCTYTTIYRDYSKCCWITRTSLSKPFSLDSPLYLLPSPCLPAPLEVGRALRALAASCGSSSGRPSAEKSA